MTKKRTAQLLGELKRLSREASDNMYRRIEIAIQVLDDYDWIADVHKGSRDAAVDSLAAEGKEIDMKTITEYRQKRDRIERLCRGNGITAICRRLDREADQRGDQESGYGPGQYWLFFRCCRVRRDGAGFRVDDDPAN